MVGAFPGSPSLAGVLCAVVEAALVLPWHPGGVAVQISMVFGFWPDESPGELGLQSQKPCLELLLPLCGGRLPSQRAAAGGVAV